MPIIIYNKSEWEDKQNEINSSIQKRYGELKTKINASTSSQQYISSLTNQINQLNGAFGSITQEAIENAIATSSLSKLEEYLSTISQSINSSNSAKIIETMQALEGINSLMSRASSSNNPIRIDATQWNNFYQSMLQNSKHIMPNIGYMSNLLGQVGAAAGQLRMQEVLNTLTSSMRSTPNMLISDVGSKKTSNTKQTVTTDILITTPDNSTLSIVDHATGANLSLNLSAKFNTRFESSKQSSTRNSIKLATRTVGSFISSVPSDRGMYETALYNYISYHRDKGNTSKYYFYNYIAKEKDWQNLRRCVGAELLYQELTNSGKGQFSFGGGLYNDTIDIYSYGNKLFLADTIAKSAFTKANEISPVATPNLTDKRHKLLHTSRNGFEIHGGRVQVQNEGQAEEIISHVSLTYSQVIRFS